MASKLAGLRLLLAPLGSIGVVTFIFSRVLHVSPTTVALLLMLIVLVTATATRLLFAIGTALFATLCLDVFFLPPIGYITISDPQNWVSLCVFCSVSLVAGRLSSQLRTQRDSVMAQQGEAERLHALNRSLLMSSTGNDMRRRIVNGSTQLFELDEFALFESLDGSFHRSGSPASLPEQPMRTATEKGIVCVQGTEWMLVPVSLGNLRFGSMAYRRRTALPVATVDAWASTVALGLAQIQAQESASRAQAVHRSEELKSVMIDALAHDLKTPLTSIEAAAEMLARDRTLSPAQATDMIAVIQEETRGLRRLVDEATHLARIDAKRLKLELRPESVGNLVHAAIQSLGEKSAGSRIRTSVAPGLALVLVDNELIVQALKQLLDNALKYGTPRSAVNVLVDQIDESITVSVRDSGPGLTELEQSKVFEKFYRGRYDRSAIQGTGMGLSIAREIVEAHGGSVGVRSYVGQGTEFFISLKAFVAPVSPQELTA